MALFHLVIREIFYYGKARDVFWTVLGHVVRNHTL